MNEGENISGSLNMQVKHEREKNKGHEKGLTIIDFQVCQFIQQAFLSTCNICQHWGSA